MTIARRLTLLLAIPLIALIALGFFVRTQINRVETLSRFVVDLQVESLTTLGHISRSFAEARVSVRNYLLADGKVEQARAQAGFRESQAELNRLLGQYADTLISNDEDRRMCFQFRDLVRQWSSEGEQLLSLAANGRRQEAITRLFSGAFADLGLHATNLLRDWLQYNEHLAAVAGKSDLSAIGDSRRNLLVALGLVMAISSVLGFVTFRGIVHPIQALQRSVEAIADGDYVRPVPFTNANDETGGLARSVNVHSR